MEQELILTTEKMAFEGRAVARQNRFVVFVEGALPHEKVRVEITQRKRSFAHARVVEVLEPSPSRQIAPCPVFGQCGGCSFQHMAYPAQLQMKRDVLIESLHGVPGIPNIVREIIPTNSPFYFRNKMGFAFGLRDGKPVLGLHKKGDWQAVVPADACLIQSAESNEILKRTLAFIVERGVAICDEKAMTGLVRHLTVREGKHTGERMVHLHSTESHPAFAELPTVLGELCTTFILSCHRNVPEDAPPDATRVLTGSGVIHERLGRFVFEIGPSTFFQTNTLQAEKLFGVVAAWAADIAPKNAVDLYAGTGPIGIMLSEVAKNVVAIESNPESVRAAQRNIQLNALKNIEMHCAETETVGIRAFPCPTDLIVVDPPRAGLHKKAVGLLLSVGAPNLIYVSCNPATLSRDLKLLVAGGYLVEAVQPVDMFPHAFHIESVVRLKRA